MAKPESDQKLYYTIGEVSKMTGLPAYVLRFWESQFPSLKPKKNRGGSRLYTLADIAVVNQIHHLRTREKLTIPGVRTRLQLKRGPEGDNGQAETQARFKTLMGKMRADLEALLKLFP